MRRYSALFLWLFLFFMLAWDAAARQSSWIGASRRHQITCRTARNDTYVTNIQDAALALRAGLEQPYTGQGVLVGIVDVGIEYNHLNFRDPQTGRTRLKGAVLYREEGAPDSVREYYVDEAIIDTLTTDTPSYGHGTHTSGIASGSYTGLGQQGMAPGAALMLCGTSSLADEYLIDAIRMTFDRADELDVPCVINMSIGNPVGWKDGLSTFCLACDSLTEGGTKPGRVIVVSAGNDGDCAFSVEHEFTDSEPVYSLLTPALFESKFAYVNPNIDVYCSDSLSASVDYVLYDTLTHSFDEFPFEQHLLDTLEAEHDGRRHLCLDADTCFLADFAGRILAVRFRGQPGSSITAYYINNESVKCAMFRPSSEARWLQGTSNMSISDLCCTDAVLSVGAYSAVSAVTNVFNRTLRSSSEQARVCPFSSFGRTWQGVAKPDVICPGVNVVSSFSAFFEDKIEYYYKSGRYPNSPMMHVVTPEETDAPWYRPEAPGRTYYWIADQGTSMSSPVMAGIIALWLEACPTLSVQDVRDVLRETARFDEFCLTAPHGVLQAGCGKADALRGLQRILNVQEGIREIERNRECQGAFDSMGRRLLVPRSGLVISNGQKVLIRN